MVGEIHTEGGVTAIVMAKVGFSHVNVRRGVCTADLEVVFFSLGKLALYELLGGGVIIAAFFMATDYSTTPINKFGKMVFAFGCGLITVLIRFFGSYPEGVSFAVLFMNILSPYIEKWCQPKPFGKESVK